MDVVFYPLFPFLLWRDQPLTLNLENQMKQETRERGETRPLRTGLGGSGLA